MKIFEFLEDNDYTKYWRILTLIFMADKQKKRRRLEIPQLEK